MEKHTWDSLFLKIQATHGNKYFYKPETYKSYHDKIEVICQIHGSFFPTAANHINGTGCPVCAKENRVRNQTFKEEVIFEKFREIHGNIYKYHPGTYRNIDTKIPITCNEHGIFYQTPWAHRKGHGCPVCGRSITAQHLKLDERTVLTRLEEKYPDYNFKKFVYRGQSTPGVVICPQHGEVLRTYKDMMRTDSACELCSSTIKLSTNQFIQQLKDLYTDDPLEYEFLEMNYTGALEKVQIRCNQHGLFQVRPNDLKSPPYIRICPKCSIEKRSSEQKHTLETFLQTIPETFKKEDNFFETEYVSYKDEMAISCNIHGKYLITPGAYKRGYRCQKCASSSKSSQEFELFDFIKTICPEAQSRKKFKELNLELDIFIPSKNIGIEYNGLFFHRRITHLDKMGSFMASKTTLLEKTVEFQKLGIRIIHIFEDEWLKKKEIVQSRLKSILINQDKIMARKCTVKSIRTDQSAKFENQYHIQGHTPSKYRFGLFQGSDLVSIMTFSELRFEKGQKDTLELLRFCSSHPVIGGFSKLLKYAINDLKPRRIISYSDKRWSTGDVYLKNKFNKISTSSPGYYWSRYQSRYHRIGFQRHKLNKIFQEEFEKDLTEQEIMYSKGYFMVDDCGQDKWEYIAKSLE